MGSNNLSQIGATRVLGVGSQLDQYFNALQQNLLPRNSSGVVTSGAGDLGSLSYKWGNLRLSGDATIGGDVGIGTDEPNYRQTIYKASDPILQLINSTTGTTNVDGFLMHLSGSEIRFNHVESGPMTFYTSGAEKVRIDSDGNLGVGTTTPLNTFLDISSNATGLHIDGGSGIARFILEGDSSATLGLYDSNGTANQKWLHLQNSNGLAKMSSLTDAGSEQYVFLSMDHSNGNVGIGTDNPSYLLEASTSNSGNTNTLAIINTSNTAGSAAALKIETANLTSGTHPVIDFTHTGNFTRQIGVSSHLTNNPLVLSNGGLSSPEICIYANDVCMPNSLVVGTDDPSIGSGEITAYDSNGTSILECRTDSTTSTYDCIIRATVQSSSGGDGYLHINMPSADWYFGGDNDDSDTLKLSPNSNLSSEALNVRSNSDIRMPNLAGASPSGLKALYYDTTTGQITYDNT